MDISLSRLAELGSAYSLLIAEDDPLLRAWLVDLCTPLFRAVRIGSDGQEAWDLYQQHGADLVLTDVRMPRMSGVELSRRLHEARPDLPILVFSGYSDQSQLIDLVELGVADFMLKPVSLDRLLHSLQKALWTLKARAQEQADVQRLRQSVTDLKTAQDQMLLLVGHELRNPLNGILGLAGLLAPLLTGEALSYLTLIQESAQRLEHSTRKALSYARLQTKSYNPQWSRVSPAELVTASLEHLKAESQNKGLDWHIDLPQEALLFADEALAQEALLNVFENALRFSPSRSAVRVQGRREDPLFVLTVQDQGEGFQPEALARLSQPFCTGPLMNHQEGFGLGLALTALIQNSLGGSLKVENPAEGGARVELGFLLAP